MLSRCPQSHRHLKMSVQSQLFFLKYASISFFVNAFYCLIQNYSALYQIICAFSCISHLFFVPLHHQTTISGQNYSYYSYLFPKQNHYATKPVFNYGANAVGPNVFPLHSTQVCLGKTEIPPTGKSQPFAPDKTPASHFPSSRSKHYLPTPRAAMSCLFQAIFARLTLHRPNSDFTAFKLPFSLAQTFCLPYPIPTLSLSNFQLSFSFLPIFHY